MTPIEILTVNLNVFKQAIPQGKWLIHFAGKKGNINSKDELFNCIIKSQMELVNLKRKKKKKTTATMISFLLLLHYSPRTSLKAIFPEQKLVHR